MEEEVTINSVGIDFHQGQHRVRCLDDRAQPCGSFGFQTTTEGLATFIDPEQLEEVYLPSAEIHALQRLTRQRKRLESDISGRKVRIEAIIDGYLPGLRKAFASPWSTQVRAFLRARLNPFAVVRDGEKALSTFLSKASYRDKGIRAESHQIFQACQTVADICKVAEPATTINEEFFMELQDEMARELRLMETEEAESESLESRISEIYHKLHPSNNLCTIPGVGEHTAPIFLATIGDPARFRNQSAFANWTGVVPRSRQSSNMEAKGLRMTKAGPSIMRMALFQSGDIGRRWDPQMAAIYYKQMVSHGKNHKQALGAVMSHLGARVLKVLLEDRPYDLRDIQGKSVDREAAKTLILTKYHVSDDIRRERRRRNSKAGKTGETATNRTNEAAKAPQPV
jgi:transposase